MEKHQDSNRQEHRQDTNKTWWNARRLRWVQHQTQCCWNFSQKIDPKLLFFSPFITLFLRLFCLPAKKLRVWVKKQTQSCCFHGQNWGISRGTSPYPSYMGVVPPPVLLSVSVLVFSHLICVVHPSLLCSVLKIFGDLGWCMYTSSRFCPMT